MSGQHQASATDKIRLFYKTEEPFRKGIAIPKCFNIIIFELHRPSLLLFYKSKPIKRRKGEVATEIPLCSARISSSNKHQTGQEVGHSIDCNSGRQVFILHRPHNRSRRESFPISVTCHAASTCRFPMPIPHRPNDAQRFASQLTRRATPTASTSPSRTYLSEHPLPN